MSDLAHLFFPLHKALQVNKQMETINHELRRKTAYDVINDMQTADPHSVCRLVGETLTIARALQDAAHLLNHNPEEQNVP